MTDDAGPSGSSTLPHIWRREYRYLHTIATRILRDADHADDVVQEAFGRLALVDREIDEPRAWLTVVVRRLCLNRLDSAYHRRESTFGAAPPEDAPDGAVPPAGDPADRISLDDQVQRALAVVLHRLSPAERTAFVLHDVFGLPYEEIGEIVGRSAVACRQLASRGRRSIRSSPPRPSWAPPTEARATDAHRQLVERFVEACEAGDLAGLVEALDPDAVVDTTSLDGTPLGHGEGAGQVAADALRFLGPTSGTVLVPVIGDNGVDVVALYANGAHGVLDLDTTDTVIRCLGITLLR